MEQEGRRGGRGGGGVCGSTEESDTLSTLSPLSLLLQTLSPSTNNAENVGRETSPTAHPHTPGTLPTPHPHSPTPLTLHPSHSMDEGTAKGSEGGHMTTQPSLSPSSLNASYCPSFPSQLATAPHEWDNLLDERILSSDIVDAIPDLRSACPSRETTGLHSKPSLWLSSSSSSMACQECDFGCRVYPGTELDSIFGFSSSSSSSSSSSMPTSHTTLASSSSFSSSSSMPTSHTTLASSASFSSSYSLPASHETLFPAPSKQPSPTPIAAHLKTTDHPMRENEEEEEGGRGGLVLASGFRIGSPSEQCLVHLHSPHSPADHTTYLPQFPVSTVENTGQTGLLDPNAVPTCSFCPPVSPALSGTLSPRALANIPEGVLMTSENLPLDPNNLHPSQIPLDWMSQEQQQQQQQQQFSSLMYQYRSNSPCPSSPSIGSASSHSTVSSLFDAGDSPSVLELCELLSESPNVRQHDFLNMTFTDMEQKQLCKAIQLIQNAFRKCKTQWQQLPRVEDRQKHAALLIENYYSRYRQLRQQRDRAARRIQQSYRMYRNRSRELNRAALFIQQMYRFHRIRRQQPPLPPVSIPSPFQYRHS